MIRSLIFNIIKLFISIILQCYMLLTCPFVLPLEESGYKDIILKIIIFLGILLGEWGIYLLYTVRQLEDKKQNKIYTVIYMGINILFLVLILYEYFAQDFVGDILWNRFNGN